VHILYTLVGGNAKHSSGSASPEEILRVLADPERLALAGALALSPRTAGELATGTAMARSKVQRHLSRLAAVGIVEALPDRRTYRLVAETLREAARVVGPAREPGLALGAMSEDEEAVLRQYFRGGRLREVPARQAKRRVVLDRLALEFEVGVRYPEREVNEILRRFHQDHAALRRYLVDEGLLTRDRGTYWRSGGPVEV
jgi:hypothetical protein